MKNEKQMMHTANNCMIEKIVSECVKRCLSEAVSEQEEKVGGSIYYYDAKRRWYRLDQIASELKGLGIEVGRTGFNSDEEGYVNVEVTREQARMISASKFGRYFMLWGTSQTGSIDEQFDEALETEKLVKKRSKANR